MYFIFVNGKKRYAPGSKINYDQIVEMARSASDAPTVTYCGKKKGDSRRSGNLTRGQVVDVEADMVFNVAWTG